MLDKACSIKAHGLRLFSNSCHGARYSREASGSSVIVRKTDNMPRRVRTISRYSFTVVLRSTKLMIIAAIAATMGVAIEHPDLVRLSDVHAQGTFRASDPYCGPGLKWDDLGLYCGSNDPSWKVPRTEMTDSMNAGNISGSFRPSLFAAAKNMTLWSFSASMMASRILLTSSVKPKDIDMMSTFQFAVTCLIAYWCGKCLVCKK
jgi:hypothetical protein